MIKHLNGIGQCSTKFRCRVNEDQTSSSPRALLKLEYCRVIGGDNERLLSYNSKTLITTTSTKISCSATLDNNGPLGPFLFLNNMRGKGNCVKDPFGRWQNGLAEHWAGGIHVLAVSVCSKV